MTTAIVGLGAIGSIVAKNLAGGGEPVILVGRELTKAQALASELGPNASAATLAEAIQQADTLILTVWFDTIKELLTQYGAQLVGKVVVDPSNPIKPTEDGQFARTLPDGVSGGSVIAGLLPAGAHYVKAFGSLGAAALADSANRSPERAVLFYAADDLLAAKTAERLISSAGYDAVKVGGVDAALRIEVFGSLHQFGGLEGRVLDKKQAQAAL